MEFTPVGDGYRNRGIYEVTRGELYEKVAEIRERYTGSLNLDISGTALKLGTYFQIRRQGLHYKTDRRSCALSTCRRRTDDLADIIKNLTFDRHLHERRYATP